MRILITGSKGFIGSKIASHLKNKHTLLLPTHTELDLLDENLVLNFFRRRSIDLVIHCAVIGGSRKEEYVPSMFTDNLRMFFNLTRCQKYFKRMINIGSGAAYDKRFPIVSVKEDDILNHIPADDYGLYKYICAQFIHNSKSIIDLRVFGMFGEGEDFKYRFISNAICRHIFHMPITMNQNVYFDYMDINDFVHIVDFFIHHKPRFSAYNIGTGKKINLRVVANRINAIAGRNEKIIIKKNGLNKEYTCDNSRLLNEYKRLTITPFDSSIKRLYAWYYKNQHVINKHTL